MANYLIVGYGRMGKLVWKVLEERGEHLWGIIEPDKEKLGPDLPAAVASEIKCIKADDRSDVDSAICFTSPDAGYETTRHLLECGIDTIVGTTKWYLNEDKSVNQEMMAELDALAREKECRFVYASNFSIGMNAFWQNLKQIAPVMAKTGYDPAVVEEHHTRKADISGTAMTIGNILLDAYPDKSRLKVGNFDQKIEPDEISIAVVRAGDTPGTHKVIFDSGVDRIELVHAVRDRMIFAKGAVDTAHWAGEQPPGGYSITDRLK